MRRHLQSGRPVLIAATLFLLGVPLLGAGCGGGGGGGTAGPTKIVIWEQRDPQERAVMEALIEEYKAAHTGVEVSLVHYDTENLRTQYQTAAVAGGGPDLVYGPSDQVGPFSVLGIIEPLNEVIPAEWWPRFLPESFDTLSGKVWALPDQVGNHLTLLYNTSFIAAPPETFDDLVRIAKENTVDEDGDGRIDRYGIALQLQEPFWMVPFLTAYGGWVMDADGTPTLDTPATVRTLRFFASLREEHEVTPREMDYQLMDTLFKEGKAAMIVNGPWSFRDYEKAGVPFKLARIPRAEPGGRWAGPMVGSKGYSINVNVPPAKLPAVLDLLEFLTSTEATVRFAKELGTLPSVKEAYEDPALHDNEIIQASRSQLEVGRRMPVVAEMRVIWDAMRPNLQAVMNGSKTPERAARDMQGEAVQKIRAMSR